MKKVGHVTMYSAKRGGQCQERLTVKKVGHVTMYSAKRGGQ